MEHTPEDLKRRISAAKKAESTKTGINQADENKETVIPSGARMAMRAATDMVSALVVGGFLGYWLDKWLDTTPWFMIIMFFLGSIAGFVNIYRSQMGQDYKVGFKKEEDDKTDKK